MKKVIFKGAGVALVTPFDEQGNINYEVLGELIEFQIAGGTDAIVICGTTGESSTLSSEEQLRIIDYAVKKVNKRIPLIAGTGGNDTKEVLELSIEAAALGADGLLVVTPYYNKTSQRGLVKHYNIIADAVNIPIILYEVPSRTGLKINPETYQTLAMHENIVATKDATGDLAHTLQVKALCGDNLHIYSGNDDQITSTMSLGGIGVISVLSNVVPDVVHNMTHAAINEDFVTCRDEQIKYLKLINHLFCDVNPIPVKAALNMMGYNATSLRLPLVELDEVNKVKLEQVMSEYGLVKKKK